MPINFDPNVIVDTEKVQWFILSGTKTDDYKVRQYAKVNSGHM